MKTHEIDWLNTYERVTSYLREYGRSPSEDSFLVALLSDHVTENTSRSVSGIARAFHVTSDPIRTDSDCIIDHVLQKLGVPATTLDAPDSFIAGVVEFLNLMFCDEICDTVGSDGQEHGRDGVNWNYAADQIEEYCKTTYDRWLNEHIEDEITNKAWALNKIDSNRPFYYQASTEATNAGEIIDYLIEKLPYVDPLTCYPTVKFMRRIVEFLNGHYLEVTLRAREKESESRVEC